MANPQKENGYTAIANELMDAFCRTRISGEAWQVLTAIIRKTYGYNKSSDMISLSQFCIMTTMQKSSVARAIRYLKGRNIIKTKPSGLSTIYQINKNYDEWTGVYNYDRKEIFKRDGYMCHICHSVKKETDLEVDHIVPLWLNGSNKPDNLKTACMKCNRTKGAERLRYTNLPQCQNDNQEVYKVATKAVAKLPHTKDNTKDNTKESGVVEAKASPTPKEKTKFFFKGITDFLEKKKTSEAELLGEILKKLSTEYGVESLQKKKKFWDEIVDFGDYWQEKTHNGKYEKWELQKTFDVEKRLRKWFRNNEKWSFNRNNQGSVGETIDLTKK